MANFTVGAARDLPLNEDKSWDGAAAKASIFAWAGFDGDSPSPEKARKGFLVYDSENPELKGSYKLPFAQVLNGTLTALSSGVRAAASRLPQTNGLSSETEASARAVIEHYEGKSTDSSDPKRDTTTTGSSDMADYVEVVTTIKKKYQTAMDDHGIADPADLADMLDRSTRIQLTDEEEESLAEGVQYSRIAELHRITDPTDVADLIDRIAAQSPLFDRDMYASSDNPPFSWMTQASNTKMDTYYTHMMPSTLKNYARDAVDGGVPFMHAHDPNSMPIGRSLGGQYIGGDDPRAMIDFFSVPGIRSKDITSDDFYRGMMAGVFRDVSVGFYGGTYVCDLCGRDLMSYDCSHFPGLKYPADEGNTKSRAKDGKGKMVVATAGIDDAHLAEVSTVYHGSCPGAVIIKARGLARSGDLRPELARMLESHYRIALPTRSVFTSGIKATNTSEEVVANEKRSSEDNMADKKDDDKVVGDGKEQASAERAVEVREVEKVVEVVKAERAMELVVESERATLTDLGVEEDATAQRAIGVLMAQIRELKPLADDGKAYREHCIGDGIKAVTRVYGPDADVERYRGVLAKESIETIRQMTEDWNKLADRSLKGGRQTNDGTEPVSLDKKRSNVPDRLFAV